MKESVQLSIQLIDNKIQRIRSSQSEIDSKIQKLQDVKSELSKNILKLEEEKQKLQTPKNKNTLEGKTNTSSTGTGTVSAMEAIRTMSGT